MTMKDVLESALKAQENLAKLPLLIDGDIIAYQAAYSATDAADAVHRARAHIRDLKEQHGSKTVEVYLTDPASPKAYRFQAVGLKPYQGNRTDKERPACWQPVRDFLTKHSIVETVGEADDAISIRAHELKGKCLIWSLDKDLRQVPGYHVAGEHMIQVELGTYFIGAYDGKIYGDDWFWTQMLMGDTADNIVGLPKIGEKKARKMLEVANNNQEAYDIVFDAYMTRFPENGLDLFRGHASMLYLRRNKEELDRNFTFTLESMYV